MRFWRRQWQPTPVLLPGKFHGWRSLVGCSPWGRKVGHNWATSISLFIFMHWRRKCQPTPGFLPGESRGREAWWAAIYGVAQNHTRLKRLSSSSSKGVFRLPISYIFSRHFLICFFVGANKIAVHIERSLKIYQFKSFFHLKTPLSGHWWVES